METLTILEQKIVSLIDVVKQLKEENTRLAEENNQLCTKLTMMESVAHNDAKHVEELDQEKALTKIVVEDLIKSIDSLIEGEK